LALCHEAIVSLFFLDVIDYNTYNITSIYSSVHTLFGKNNSIRLQSEYNAIKESPIKSLL